MSWRITSTTSSILRQTKENEYSIPENTPAVGGTVQQRYYFEGINYGTAYIEFSYGRPWEEAPPERTFGRHDNMPNLFITFTLPDSDLIVI